MNLIPVQTSELSVGQPLPWDLFKQDQTPVLARGSVINTVDELQSLGQTMVFRVGDTPTAEAAAAAPRAAVDEVPRFRFEDMRLRVGDKLHLSPSPNPHNMRSMVKLIGYVQDSTLLVSAPPSDQWRPLLSEGDAVAVRVFSGENAFGCNVYVERIIKLPFVYLHLSFPKHIFGKVIRKSRRIRTDLPAKVEGSVGPVVVSNLSASGAELRAAAGLGEIGASIGLSFSLNVHGVEMPLSLRAAIRSLRQEEDGGEEAVRYGLEFQELKLQDSATLRSMIYQVLVENPQNVA